MLISSKAKYFTRSLSKWAMVLLNDQAQVIIRSLVISHYPLKCFNLKIYAVFWMKDPDVHCSTKMSSCYNKILSLSHFTVTIFSIYSWIFNLGDMDMFWIGCWGWVHADKVWGVAANLIPYQIQMIYVWMLIFLFHIWIDRKLHHSNCKVRFVFRLFDDTVQILIPKYRNTRIQLS